MTPAIVDFADLSDAQQAQAARILRGALPSPTGYKGPGEAEAEVARIIAEPDRWGLAAVVGGNVRGFIGALRGYSHSLELHPLVVDPAFHGQGVGRNLVGALEARARAEGYLALWLGADDDFGGTSLDGAGLFPNVLARADAVTAGRRHPLGFYRRLGFEIVGLIPDANGPGKPDILMSKALK